MTRHRLKGSYRSRRSQRQVRRGYTLLKQVLADAPQERCGALALQGCLVSTECNLYVVISN